MLGRGTTGNKSEMGLNVLGNRSFRHHTLLGVLLVSGVLIAPPIDQPQVLAQGQQSIRQGEKLYRRGDYSAAIVLLTEVIAQNSEQAYTYFLRGIVHLTMGNPEAAQLDFSHALRLQPSLVSAYYLRGLNRIGFDSQKSMLAYTNDLKQDANDAAAYAGRGRIHVALGHTSEAIQDLSKAISLKPDDLDSHLLRGQMHRFLKDYQRAIADYTVALKLDPQVVVAYIERGTAHDDAGNHRLAIADYNKAIELDSTNSRAYYNRGVTHKEPTQKVADYDRAIQLNPQGLFTYLAHNNRGDVQRGQEQLQDAIASFTQAITLSPNYALAYRNRGLAYSSLDNYRKAIEDFSQVLTLDPDDALAYAARGLAHANLDDRQQARQDYDQAIQLYPDDSQSLDHALVYHKRALLEVEENPKGALKDYTRAIQINPQAADVYIGRVNPKQRLKIIPKRFNWMPKMHGPIIIAVLLTSS